MATPEEIKAASDKALGLSLDAQSVADRKNADQAAADQKIAAEALSKIPVVISGDAVLGGPANIYGDRFGPKGTLSIGGREIPTPLWEDKRISFVLAPGTRGAVVLTTSTGVRHGTFPVPANDAPTRVEVTVNVDGKATTPIVK